jgi:coenzyme F420-reducing hydrogenase beta subunit
MSTEAEKRDAEDQLIEKVQMFVLGEVGGIEEVKDVEENAGSMWITTKDGKVYSISVMECEPEENDEEV